MEQQLDELKFFIAETLPFLKEAWEACFNGQEEKMLSAEERGMAYLIGKFEEVANNKPPIPPNCITYEEHDMLMRKASEYYLKMVPEHLKKWVLVGETCVHGIKRCSEENDRLREALQDLTDAINKFRNDTRASVGEEVGFALVKAEKVLE